VERVTADTLSNGPTPPLPEGVVTFLFSDIEGSTRLLERLGDRYAEVLSTHRTLLRHCFAEHGGREVDTEGDAFFVAFSSPREAVAAAAEGQRALHDHPWPDVPLRVRMGLHAGEPRLMEDHYVGIDVHRAARICSAAHGGQVVISSRLLDLLGSREVTGVRFRDLGAHRLKDLDEPEQLHQLDIEGLPTTFPPLRSLRPPTNLPQRAAAMVGRHVERRELRELLESAEVRLVTVTGPGGVGKTRLVETVALEMLDQFPHGVHFVDLTDVDVGSSVLPAVARVLGLPLGGDELARRTLSEYVGERRALLVLDNAEQVRDAALPVGGLLEDCPRLTVLVTSRRFLGLQDEHEYPLSPMGLPTGSSRAAVAASEAAQLFLSRARRSRHDMKLTADNAAAIAQICTLLDGLPLAVELAAARTRLFSPKALAARLGDRFALLTTGAPDVPPRHRTLRATVEWSYALLTASEREFFRDLSVFAGGARVDGIEAVTAREPDDVLDLLSSLVEHSLLTQAEDADGEPRFTMLRTLRDYAEHLLHQDPGHEEDLRERHAQHFLAVVEQAMTAARPLTRRSLHRVEQDHDNVHAALTFWLEESHRVEAPTKALRLASLLAEYWYRHGQARDGSVWLERALAAAVDPGAATRADALRMLGQMHEQRRDPGEAAALLTQAADLYRGLGDRHGEADCLDALGMVARSVGEYVEAQSLLEEAARIRRDIGDEAGLASTLNNLAVLTSDCGEPDEQTTRPAVEAMVRFLAVADLDGVIETLEACVGLAVAEARWTTAARLAGAAKAARRRHGLPRTASERAPLEVRIAEIREHLDEDAFGTALREGERLTLDQATGSVVSELLER
jgi:predicted ATPase/class 3 adenylate cyclase